MPKYATEYIKDGIKCTDTIVARDEASAKLVCSGRKRGEVIIGEYDDSVADPDSPVSDAVAEIQADEGVDDEYADRE